MYTLVSASVLAIDLSRHPGGAAVADVADRVLALDGAELAALAAAADRSAARDAARERTLAAARRSPRMSGLMRDVRAEVAGGLPGPAAARTIVDALSETLLGGLDDLLSMLRTELAAARPGVPGEGVLAALDAVAAAWTGRGDGDAALSDAALLRAPWDRALSPLPVPLPEAAYGGGAPALRDLLDLVARLDPAAWQRVEAAHWNARSGLRWSEAMHLASRAAADSDRLVPVARAQLAAARALRLAGVSTTAAARGVALAVCAAVQATATADLLDAPTSATLLAAWEAATSGA